LYGGGDGDGDDLNSDVADNSWSRVSY